MKAFRELRGQIEKLERERVSLREEIESLKAEVARVSSSFVQMSRKQICFIIVLGTVLTSVIVSFPPFFIDPLVSGALPLSTLDKEIELVSYLREMQDCENVYVGVHGYDHKCPLCGANDHELTCLRKHDLNCSNIPSEEIQRRIEAGLAIFNRSGLKADWYAFLGMVYEERALRARCLCQLNCDVFQPIFLRIVHLEYHDPLIWRS